VYAYPANEGSKFKFYVFPYVYPYFHQSWTLFAPVPKENFNVYVKHDGGEWEDLFYKLYSSNQNNRFGGNEALMLAFSNSLRYYASSVSELSSKEDDDDTNVNFVVLKKMIVNYYRSGKNPEVKNLEVIIRIRNINGRSDYSHYYKLKN
jgi:hypothetical protein